MRTPEEIAEELFGQSGNASVDLVLAGFKSEVVAALRAYGTQERERCIKALCSYCKKGIPLENDYHQIRDGLVPLGADYRVKMCPAALLHRLD
jgi:hypothetical protein